MIGTAFVSAVTLLMSRATLDKILLPVADRVADRRC